jgi:hypothetical protein
MHPTPFAAASPDMPLRTQPWIVQMLQYLVRMCRQRALMRPYMPPHTQPWIGKMLQYLV